MPTKIETTFDDGLDGWTSNEPHKTFWEASGGDSGGYLGFLGKIHLDPVFIAPPMFSGNLASFEGGQFSIEYTGYILANEPELTLVGADGERIHGLLFEAGHSGSFEIYSTTLSDENFGSGHKGVTLESVLQDLAHIRLKFSDAPRDFAGIDNVTLTAPIHSNAPHAELGGFSHFGMPHFDHPVSFVV